MEKYMDLELRRHRNDLPYMDWEQWSPLDDLPQEKDIFKQHQNHLNPSASPESQLFPGEEILRSYVKKLRTRPSFLLPQLVKHSDAFVNGDVSGERNTASNWIATTYVVVHIRETKTETAYDDGYRWKKYGQKDILGSKYPREFFRCKHHSSEECPARKQVQRLDEDPTLFKVIHLRRHTCEQFSHLYTGAALITTEGDSDYTVFSRNIEAALMWTIARLDGYSWRKIAQSDDLRFKYPTLSGYFRCPHSESEGCLARKCVERSDRGRTRFKVTHLGKHTCKQFSHLATSAAVEPTEADSDDKEVSGKKETALMRTASVADKYRWRKSEPEDIPVSEYPRVYIIGANTIFLRDVRPLKKFRDRTMTPQSLRSPMREDIRVNDHPIWLLTQLWSPPRLLPMIKMSPEIQKQHQSGVLQLMLMDTAGNEERRALLLVANIQGTIIGAPTNILRDVRPLSMFKYRTMTPQSLRSPMGKDIRVNNPHHCCPSR